MTERDARAWLEVRQEGWISGRRLSFAVLYDEAADAPDHVVGNVVLKEYAAGQDSAEVGYWTAPAARCRGVASTAVEMLTTWAFKTLGPPGLQRIELLHQQGNLSSCRVAQKSGYVLTGVIPADPPSSLPTVICTPGTHRADPAPRTGVGADGPRRRVGRLQTMAGVGKLSYAGTGS